MRRSVLAFPRANELQTQGLWTPSVTTRRSAFRSGGCDAPPHSKASSIVVDFITPQTDTSIWYFWGMARNFNIADEALTETIRAGQAAIFAEDLAMLESQQRNLAEQPRRHLMRLNIDMGGFESRRILERLVAEEHNDLLRAQGGVD